jgi:hypothetical protein
MDTNLRDITLLVYDDGIADFGQYARELLRLEGLQANVVSLRDFDATQLTSRVIIASNLPLKKTETERLRAHAANGNRLIFFAPAPYVAAVFGFAPTYRATVDGLMRLRVAGFTDEPMQFHAALRHCKLPDDAEVLAHVCDHAAPYAPTDEAAIVRVPIEQGEAYFFLYDLPRSLALTRQGDPRRSLLHGNHVWPGWRAADMFADFLNLDCAHLPQADLQCHLLRHWLCLPLAHETLGLPFVWYFPDEAPTVLLLSSDEDWSTPAQFQALHDCVRQHDAQITYYLVEDTCITPEQMAAWQREGDTFSIHPAHQEPLPRTWHDTIQKHRASFEARFTQAPGPSIRNHIIAWVGYTQAAQWNNDLGFAWDSNYFTCPPKTKHYMTGGGLPLPIVNEAGTVTRTWELPAQFSDETTLAAGGFEFSLQLSEDEAFNLIGDLLRANAAQHHSLLCVNTHPVSFATYSGGLWDSVLTEAKRLNIPRLSLEAFAQFWEQRQQIRIGATQRTRECPLKGMRAQWTVQLPAHASSTLLVPAPRGATFMWNGQTTPVSWRTVHGAAYAVVPLPAATATQVSAQLQIALP